jgi:hypothetical protein
MLDQNNTYCLLRAAETFSLRKCVTELNEPAYVYSAAFALVERSTLH